MHPPIVIVYVTCMRPTRVIRGSVFPSAERTSQHRQKGSDKTTDFSFNGATVTVKAHSAAEVRKQGGCAIQDCFVAVLANCLQKEQRRDNHKSRSLIGEPCFTNKQLNPTYIHAITVYTTYPRHRLSSGRIAHKKTHIQCNNPHRNGLTYAHWPSSLDLSSSIHAR